MNKTLQKILGYTVMALPIIVSLVMMAILSSLKVAVTVFALSAGFAVLVMLSVHFGGKILDSVPKE